MTIRITLILTILLAGITFLNALAFQDGEKLTFTVKYGIVHAAEAILEVRSETYQGAPVWYLSTNARTFPFFDVFFKVRDKVESWWDKSTLLPYKFSKTLQEGTYRQHRIMLFDQKKGTSSYHKWSYKKKKYNTEEVGILNASQDVLSAFYYIRNQQLTPGKTLSVNITIDGRSVATNVVVHRREKVKTIFGTINCLVIEPKLKNEGIFRQSGKITIWVSDDAYKIPVKLESAVSFGSFVAVLKEAKNVPYKVKD